jgi:uncharacterized repeat protein (TIGR01451 family)
VPGTPTTYTITVSNSGPSTVSSVILTDDVPTALLNPTFGTPSAGSYDPATHVWSGLSLATDQSVTITVSGTIDPAATGTLTNTATVAPPSGVIDPNPDNNSASDTLYSHITLRLVGGGLFYVDCEGQRPSRSSNSRAAQFAS